MRKHFARAFAPSMICRRPRKHKETLLQLWRGFLRAMGNCPHELWGIESMERPAVLGVGQKLDLGSPHFLQLLLPLFDHSLHGYCREKRRVRAAITKSPVASSALRITSIYTGCEKGAARPALSIRQRSSTDVLPKDHLLLLRRNANRYTRM